MAECSHNAEDYLVGYLANGVEISDNCTQRCLIQMVLSGDQLN